MTRIEWLEGGETRSALWRSESGWPAPKKVVIADDTMAADTAYRLALSEIRADPYSGTLPRDATYLSWTLAACAPLPLHDRQALLEADDAGERLVLVTDLLRSWTGLAAVRLLAATVWRRHPVTRHDGPASVRGAYTLDELRGLARRAGLGEVRARSWFLFDRAALVAELDGAGER